jgi:endoglucanase Acf2
MFGYRLIKNVEIENLKSNLKEANFVIAENEKKIAELIEKINNQEKIIVKLTETSNGESNSVEEKPVKKKVRRKNTKKNTKKEE